MVIPWLYLIGMKTAISVPDPIFRRAGLFARKLHLSRSRLFATAVDQYMRNHPSENVTDKLNAVYQDAPSRIGPALRAMQGKVLSREKW